MSRRESYNLETSPFAGGNRPRTHHSDAWRAVPFDEERITSRARKIAAAALGSGLTGSTKPEVTDHAPGFGTAQGSLWLVFDLARRCHRLRAMVHLPRLWGLLL